MQPHLEDSETPAEGWQPPSFQVMMASKPFRFLVGPEGKEYFVNEEAIKNLSEVFQTMMDGPWKEANTRCAELPDVSEVAFGRLCEFAYTGKYTDPVPEDARASRKRKAGQSTDASAAKKVRVNGDTAAETATDASNRSDPVVTPPTSSTSVRPYSIYSACRNYEKYQKELKAKPAKAAQRQPFLSEDRYNLFMEFHCLRMYWDEPCFRKDARENRGIHDNWSPIFLGHAEMYMIGDKYDIQKLRDVSRSKLHRALKFWVIYPERIQDLIRLIHYVYDNTVELDKMREMIYFYASCIVEDIVHLPSFQTFLRCAPEFSQRVIELMAAKSRKG